MQNISIYIYTIYRDIYHAYGIYKLYMNTFLNNIYCSSFNLRIKNAIIPVFIYNIFYVTTEGT